MSVKPKIAISIGDVNGIGVEIALRAHKAVSAICDPIYCIDQIMLERAASLLHVTVPENFTTLHVSETFEIHPGVVAKESGQYSFDSFKKAIELCEAGDVDAMVTLPIHKEAWSLAGLEYVGHTDMLRKHFSQDAIMMLGCEKMYVALYTEHIPLQNVAASLEYNSLTKFLLDLHRHTNAQNVAVLGLNPHAGDNGVLGDEESIIAQAIDTANENVGKTVFIGPVVPDTAFTPAFRKQFQYFVAMYHDQGLAPLKALYFEEGINISLNLSIIRTSVDHGTAFDIAYQNRASLLSYSNAIKAAIRFSQQESYREA